MVTEVSCLSGRKNFYCETLASVKMVRQVVWYLIVDEGLVENRSHLHLSSSIHRCCRLCFLDSSHVGCLRCGNIGGVSDVGIWDLLCLQLLETSELNSVVCVDEELCGGLHFGGEVWSPGPTDVSGTARLKKSSQLWTLCLILYGAGKST